MPIYEYQCEKCGFHFDKLQNLREPPLEKCPECKVSALKKLVSAPSFKLKGSGWYETDFKNKKSTTDSQKNTAATPAAKSNVEKTSSTAADKSSN